MNKNKAKNIFSGQIIPHRFDIMLYLTGGFICIILAIPSVIDKDWIPIQIFAAMTVFFFLLARQSERKQKKTKNQQNSR